jgi:hypothetical protein
MKRLLTALTTTLLIATAAATATATANTAHAADRVDRITAGLRQSPLFVDPDVSYLLDARERTTLGEQLKTAGVPIYLVVVPLRSEDESAGDGEYLGSLLHQRLGRNGIYLVADQHGGIDEMAYQVPRDTTLDFSLATSDAPLPRKLHDVIDAYAHAPKAAPSDPAKPRTPELDEDQKKSTSVGLTGQFMKTFFPSLLLSGLVLAVLWFFGLGTFRIVRAVRGARRSSLGPRRLRRTAEAELVRLARAIGAAGEENPGYPRAMAGYDAAKLLYDEKDDPGSRFGVVVLALEGQDALRDETADPAPRCMVDPFHGTADQRVRRRLADLPDGRRPLCDACEKSHDLRPLTLEIDGRKRPYYAAPGLWEKLHGRTADLPGRVLEYLGVD